MVKRQVKLNKYERLVNAIEKVAKTNREIAEAIREQDRNQSKQNLANNLRAFGHLVFVGLVIAQAFAREFDADSALLGIITLAIVYTVAYIINRR